GNLDLRLARLAILGGDGGSAIVPGDPAGSRLLARMRSGEMPPTEKKVPPDQIALIEQWIAEGARTLRPEPEDRSPGVDITAQERAYWFFQPIVRVEPAALTDTVSHPAQLADHPGASIVRTLVDAFVLNQLRERGLRFAPDADKLTLIRR